MRGDSLDSKNKHLRLFSYGAFTCSAKNVRVSVCRLNYWKTQRKCTNEYKTFWDLFFSGLEIKPFTFPGFPWSYRNPDYKMNNCIERKLRFPRTLRPSCPPPFFQAWKYNHFKIPWLFQVFHDRTIPDLYYALLYCIQLSLACLNRTDGLWPPVTSSLTEHAASSPLDWRSLFIAAERFHSGRTRTRLTWIICSTHGEKKIK